MPQPDPGSPGPAAVSRRGLLRAGVEAGLAGLILGSRAGAALAAATPDGTTAWPQATAESTGPDPLSQQLSLCHPQGDPLEALLAGNRRFAQVWRQTRGELDPRERMQRFAELWSENCQPDPASLARGQRPWAAVLACADSRVAPEWLFDVGPGELFDVRSAGNTAFAEGIASLEYAVAELQVPLIVVMGHQSCGAVTAALADQPLTPLLAELLTSIQASLQPGDDLTQAIQHNTTAAARQLSERSAVLRKAVAARKLRIQPLYFDLESGLTTLI